MAVSGNLNIQQRKLKSSNGSYGQIINKVIILETKSAMIVNLQYNNNIAMDHVTVSCLVAWPLNESEAGGDHVLRETS